MSRFDVLHALFALVFAALLLPQSAHAQRRITTTEQVERTLVRMPAAQVEIPSLNPDNRAWGSEKAINELQTIRVRWGNPANASSAVWQLADAPFPDADVLASGPVPTPGREVQWAEFALDLDGLLPANAPAKDKHYYLRVVTRGEREIGSRTITLIHRHAPSSTRFTAAGLHPELFQPMPIYIDMHTFNLIKADEEDDEEPYIIPVLLYFDGTTVQDLDPQQWSVRLQTSARANVHENIPQYNSSIGSNDRIAIPPDVGYFEQDILPVSMNLADTNLFGIEIDYTHLTNATAVFVTVLAMEADYTTAAAANAARDAVVDGFLKEINDCIHSLSLADVLTLIRTGSNPEALLTEDEGSVCGFVANEEDGSVLDQIRARLEDMAVDAATAEELDDAVNWLPLGRALGLLRGVDHDDMIGFDYEVFSYTQLMRAEGPIRFTLRQQQVDQPAVGVPNVIYEIEARIGRCKHVPGRSRCVPQRGPLLGNN